MKPCSIQIDALLSSTPLPRKYVRALRMAAWNVAFIIAGLLLITLVGEIYLRLVNPFIEDRYPTHFVDDVGLIYEPNAETRYANWDDDIFVASRANSLGFLDREPVSAERAAKGCHIAFIGDSFVEAIQVPIADKFHVRLEEMSARELPHLGVTTQAYGIHGTGQINQLPLYDEYARRLKPKLLVLVFFLNDFVNNSVALQSLAYGADPDRMPFMSAQRDASGAMKLRPPDPEYKRFLRSGLPKSWYGGAWERLVQVSYSAKWLEIKRKEVKRIVKSLLARIGAPVGPDSLIVAWANMIAERPCCSLLLDGWQPTRWAHIQVGFPVMAERLPPVWEEALEYTAFGVEQFKLRADRDGAQLAILAVHSYMGTQGDPQFDRLSAIAETYDIPVISQYDYMVSQEYEAEDAVLGFDYHWSPTGHQWAAEAVMEWLNANQDVCA